MQPLPPPFSQEALRQPPSRPYGQRASKTSGYSRRGPELKEKAAAEASLSEKCCLSMVSGAGRVLNLRRSREFKSHRYSPRPPSAQAHIRWRCKATRNFQPGLHERPERQAQLIAFRNIHIAHYCVSAPAPCVDRDPTPEKPLALDETGRIACVHAPRNAIQQHGLDHASHAKIIWATAIVLRPPAHSCPAKRQGTALRLQMRPIHVSSANGRKPAGEASSRGGETVHT